MSDFFKQQLDALESKGLKRKLFNRDESPLVNFSSNDYLGLSRHAQVVEAAKKALDDLGTGSAASRLLAGTLSLHDRFEKKLADFLGKESALLFSSGYHVNTGVLPALTSSEDVIFADRLCHASIIDGLKLSKARFFTFDHNDMADLEKLLQTKRASYQQAFIVTEGIFSMDGDVCSLPELVQLKKQFNARLYLDESHSFGICGPEGKGWAAACGLLDAVDIWMGTCSKTLGAQGGVIAGSQLLRDLLISTSRSFIYTTSLAPASVGAALAALILLPSLEDRRRVIAEASYHVREQLLRQGFEIIGGLSDTPIIPVLTGDVPSTLKLSGHLLSQGFFVPSIRPPTVPLGEGRVRLSISYEAAMAGLDSLLSAFASAPEKPVRKGETRVVEIG